MSSRKAVALTGAGISTPSGLPEFRSPDSGLWQNVDPFEVATIFAFRRKPEAFFNWIHPLARLTMNAQPNIAHIALAQLESFGPLAGVITQNIDDLHGKAGSKRVYEVHGNWREVTCIRCYSIYPVSPHLDNFMDRGEVPLCPGCGGVLKPNVILFGEQLPVGIVNQARKLTQSCDLMLVVGSSLQVAPAGDLPLLALNSGARLVIINLEPTVLDDMADVVIHADVVDVLPRLAEPFLGESGTNS